MCILLLFPVKAAFAQLLKDERIETFLTSSERVPEELKPDGISYKGLVFRPSLNLGIRYDSNIFASTNGEESDLISTFKPAILILKKYDGHQLLLGSELDIERFIDHKDENTEGHKSFLQLNLNPNSKWLIPLKLEYARRFQKRNAPQNNGLTTEPARINELRFETGIIRRFNALSLGLIGKYKQLRFDDGVTTTGTEIVRRDSNNQDYAIELQGRYALLRDRDVVPEHIIYTNLSVGKQDYKRQQYLGPAFGYTGDSSDNKRLQLLAGLETNYKGLLFANIGAGFSYRDYDDEDLDNTTELDLIADISYNITPKFTLNFDAIRNVEEDNEFVQGLVRTSFGGGGEYEILHDWYVDGHLEYTTFDFFDDTREDEDIIFEAGLRHLISQNLTAEANLIREQRSSNIAANEYERMIMMFQLTGKL